MADNTISDEIQQEWRKRLSKVPKTDLVGRLIMAYTTIMNLEQRIESLEKKETP
jgi:hypothetical protein